MDYNILEQLTLEEADAVIAYCIPKSERYKSCLTFDEWVEQGRDGKLPSNFKDMYNLYIKECILTPDEQAREYHKLV